ncbi:DUF3995 domain-containing protein [Streptomyces sp. M41]|uniref:DUF3995 domain-containing protein n=1 Tax=Streptomyces sp. M41 TaxID=3059412 RepID=UPI00374DF211
MTLTKIAGGTAALGLGAVAALHGIWTFSPWPLEDRTEFALTVVGVAEADLPSPQLTATVAAALGAAACLTAAEARLIPKAGPRRARRIALWTLSGVLGLRGVAGLVDSGLAGGSTSYARWDLALYSPLCLALGGLTAYVAASTAGCER